MDSLFGNQLIISTQRHVNRVYPRGGNRGWKQEFPSLELETGVSVAGNWGWKQGLETGVGNRSFQRWKLELPSLETGVSVGGNSFYMCFTTVLA